MRPSISTLSESAQSKVRSSIKNQNYLMPALIPSWLVKLLDEEDSSFKGLFFTGKATYGSLLTWNRAHHHLLNKDRFIKIKYEGYSVSLHVSKQITSSCLCPRSDYRHRYCKNRVASILLASHLSSPSCLDQLDRDSLFSSTLAEEQQSSSCRPGSRLTSHWSLAPKQARD